MHTFMRSASVRLRVNSLLRRSLINSITVLGSMNAVEDMSVTNPENHYQYTAITRRVPSGSPSEDAKVLRVYCYITPVFSKNLFPNTTSKTRDGDYQCLGTAPSELVEYFGRSPASFQDHLLTAVAYPDWESKMSVLRESICAQQVQQALRKSYNKGSKTTLLAFLKNATTVKNLNNYKAALVPRTYRCVGSSLKTMSRT